MAISCPKCQSENPDDTIYCGKCAAPLTSAEGISITKTLITPTESLQRGSTFAGRYQILEELGRGGMGIVYKAKDSKLKRTVALKFLPPELTHIPDIKERFMREAQTAASLDHPNICTVHEFDEAEEKTFISMAYIKGQSLKKKIDSGPLELDEALKIATQVAEGLQEAHKKGVIHRDIKSANIMMDERDQAKIMDFGLARMAGKTMLTQEGTTMGTIAYMSPEQARGEEVDHRSDIWSLGVVLYEMFTGRLPFKGEHEQAVVYSILKEKPEPVSKLVADIPPSIEQVVYRALEKSLDKRYQNIDVLLKDLKSISAGIVPEEIKTRLRKETLRKRKRAILYAGAAGLVIILVVLGLTLLKGPPETIDSIAVLPLENLTGDAQQDYFADGATDELIGQLAQIGALRVISRTSVMKYKNTDKSLPEIARELNVDAVVEGTVYQVGENVRIRVQLIDALPEERNLWAHTYERAGTDVLVMYGEMARAIADNTKVELTSDEKTRLASARKVDPKAYEAYLKGMSHWYKLTPPDLDAALQYFESALEKDPDYALALTGIALVWIGRNQFGSVQPSVAVPKVQEAALKALELDNTLAEVHFVLAALRTWHDGEWNWKAAEKSFLRAIELNPNYPDARVYYSNLLCYLDRPDEALAQAERALELDPLNSLFMSIYGSVLLSLGRYDEATKQVRNALKTSPNDPVAHSILQEVYHIKGQYEEALAEAKATFSAWGLDPLVEVIEQGYEKDGYAGAMRSAAETLEAFSQEAFISPFFIAFVYAASGDKEKSLEWLEKGYEIKDPNMPYIKGHGIIDNLLHDDPRFQDLLRRMNLPQGK
ncbi:MAG: protein kinase [Candidatus Aminicenantes bacterium]|nr:protein kinase [Candidatus Aminicenantes bacterium]